MKKSRIIISLLGMIMIGLGVLYVKNLRNSEKTAQTEEFNNGMEDYLFGKEMYLDAKMDQFKNLYDVEKITDEIIIAEKISQDEPTILYGAEGRIDIAYTLSKFKVKEVVATNNLKVNDEFTMLENEAYDEKNDVAYHIAGYNLIKEGNKRRGRLSLIFEVL